MKGKLIKKWKQEGVREFIMMTLSHQIARNRIEGVEDFKLKVPQEALPFIYQTTLQNGTVDDITFFGKKIELY